MMILISVLYIIRFICINFFKKLPKFNHNNKIKELDNYLLFICFVHKQKKKQEKKPKIIFPVICL